MTVKSTEDKESREISNVTRKRVSTMSTLCKRLMSTLCKTELTKNKNKTKNPNTSCEDWELHLSINETKVWIKKKKKLCTEPDNI